MKFVCGIVGLVLIARVSTLALRVLDAPTESEIRATGDRLQSVSTGVESELGEVGMRLNAIRSWSRDAAGRVSARVSTIDADGIADGVQQRAARQSAKATTLRRAEDTLRTKDESLQATRSQSTKERQSFDDDIASASQQIEVLDGVIEEMAPAPHDGSGAAEALSAATASVLGVLKGIADGVRAESAELEAKRHESSQHFEGLLVTMQEEVAATEQAYRRASQEYIAETAGLNSARDVSGLARELDGSVRDSYQEVSVFNSDVITSMDKLPGIAQTVEGDVAHGKELIDGIAARQGQVAPTNLIVSPGRTRSNALSTNVPHHVLMSNSSAAMFRRLLNASRSGPKLLRLHDRRGKAGLAHKTSLTSTAVGSSQHKFLSSRAIASANDTLAPLTKPLASWASVRTGLSHSRLHQLNAQAASRAAAAVIRRGAVSFHSTALQRLAGTVEKTSVNESMAVLHELDVALKKRGDEDASNETSARHECERRRVSALGSKRRARQQRHQIVLENATTSGQAVSIATRSSLLSEQEEWEQLLANESAGTSLNTQSPAFNAERGDLDQVTQDVEEWAASNTISAGELEGLRTSLQGAAKALDRASGDAGTELSSTQSSLDALEARWREGSSRCRRDLQQLEEEQQEVDAKLERLRAADESARADEESADADVEAAEQMCSSTAFLAASRVRRGNGEVALVHLALSILDSAEPVRAA